MQLLRSTPFFLAGSLTLLAPATHAQTSFSIGPRVGLNVATYHFSDKSVLGTLGYRTGLEAGVAATARRGHFALQAAALYSQKGYIQRFDVDIHNNNGYNGPGNAKNSNWLHYLTIPLALSYTPGSDGQGIQVFAGPYLSLLLGGRYERVVTPQDGSAPFADSGPIAPTNQEAPDNKAYARRLDAGLQAGVGYQYHALLAQLTYSLGLRNVAAAYAYNGVPVASPFYYNRVLQGSLTYLFGKPN